MKNLTFFALLFLALPAAAAEYPEQKDYGQQGDFITKNATKYGRAAIIMPIGPIVVGMPESPGSKDTGLTGGLHVVHNYWNLADLSNPQQILATWCNNNDEDCGGGSPIAAHGTVIRFDDNTAELYSRNTQNGGWLEFDGNANGSTAQLKAGSIFSNTGVHGRILAYSNLSTPWNIDRYWSYDNPPTGNYHIRDTRQNASDVETWRGRSLTNWNHYGNTGVTGFPLWMGNHLIYASEQSQTGIAIYNTAGYKNGVEPELLTVFNPVLNRPSPNNGNDERLGGYWMEQYGTDRIVFAARKTGSPASREFASMFVVNVADKNNPFVSCEIYFDRDKNDSSDGDSSSDPMYVNFQDEYAFVDHFKVSIPGCESAYAGDRLVDEAEFDNIVFKFNDVANQCDASQYARPLGQVVLFGGYDWWETRDQGINEQGHCLFVSQNEPDTRAPFVSGTAPVNGATNVPLDTFIHVHIPETLRSETLIGNFVLTAANGTVVPARKQLSHTGLVSIWPDSDLSANTVYTVSIRGLQDFMGNTMADYAFNFSTGSTAPPVIDNPTPTPASTPTPTATPTPEPGTPGIFCAAEFATCTVPSSATVFFGADGAYNQVADVASSIYCDANAFGGDPIQGVTKACYYVLDSSPTPEPTPTSTPTATPTPEPTPAPETRVNISPDGLYLVSDDGLTLYTFGDDALNTSNCNDSCADAWPPKIALGELVGVRGLSSIDRADGSKQVAYYGKPLYFYANDTAPGDASGDGVGNWQRAAFPGRHTTNQSGTISCHADGTVAASDSDNGTVAVVATSIVNAAVNADRTNLIINLPDVADVLFVDDLLIAAVRGDDTIRAFNKSDLSPVWTLQLKFGDGPVSLLADSGYLYASLYAKPQVIKIDLSNRQIVGRIKVNSTPRAMALSNNRLLVVRHISHRDGYGEVYDIDAASMSLTRTIRVNEVNVGDDLNNGSGVPNFLSSIAFAPDNKRAYITAVKANTDNPDLDDDNTIRPMLAILDLENNRDLNEGDTANPNKTFDFDNAADPHGILYLPDGVSQVTALRGNDKLILRNQTANTSVQFNAGGAPTDMCTVGTRLFINSRSTSEITALNLDGFYRTGAPIAQSTTIVKVPATDDSLTPQEREGLQLFYASEIPAMGPEGYMSCASCHFGGGGDGMVYNMPVGKRLTIPLLGIPETGRLHRTGNFDEVQDFEQQLEHLNKGTGLASESFAADADMTTQTTTGLSTRLDALSAYVRSLSDHSFRSHYRGANGEQSPLYDRGQQVFNDNCASCHSGDAMTDNQIHTLDGVDLLTRHLQGVHVDHRGGYLFDGRAETLPDVLKRRDTSTGTPEYHQQLGESLSQPDLTSLLQFLRAQ